MSEEYQNPNKNTINLDNDDSSKKFYQAAFDNRFTTLKEAKTQSNQGASQQAVQLYNQYLKIVAKFKNVEEKDLAPKLFDPETDLSEMLVISNAYWDLAKIYDRSPKLGQESVRCLSQFVKFTVEQKYQYANNNLIKNYVRQKKAHNIKAFKDAHDKIRTNIKECFIATYCFEEENQTISTLREFRNQLYQNKLGEILVDQYYFLSPKLIQFLNKLPGEKRQFKKIITFCLKTFARIYER